MALINPPANGHAQDLRRSRRPREAARRRVQILDQQLCGAGLVKRITIYVLVARVKRNSGESTDDHHTFAYFCRSPRGFRVHLPSCTNVERGVSKAPSSGLRAVLEGLGLRNIWVISIRTGVMEEVLHP